MTDDEITDENYCDWRQSNCPWVKDLRARIAELEAALKPFVDASNAFDIKGHWPKDAVEEVLVTVGDLRAARAAYNGADFLHPTTSEKSFDE